ncbi:M48 family metalloprotease [Novosphingobium piscinae]|uniref:M48 family metalloprotease n=1 Tax=Novosphingobium piscinae TaxID=1507448 RepID=A0A7X1FXD1_9SPHN|nr:M48 family metalloprotease [Novosphingobium piscinae]MBC2668057.1 M48 family metalloprotease [Novosphingobium piscinae]
MKHSHWLAAVAALGLAAPAGAQQAATTIAVPGPQAISAADKQTGAQADPELTAEYGGVYAGPQAQLVRQVGLKVAAQSRIAAVERDFSFKLLNSGVPNAFAVPGGYVYTTRGLLALMNNEAELAFVLGHETGHIAARHTDQRQKVTQRSVLLGTLGQTLLGAILGNGAMGQVGNQIGQAGIQRLVVGTVMSHSRQDEFEADDLGVVYARQAGYDATASSDILASLAAQTALDARLTGQSRTTPGWALSHPDPAARVSRALQRARQQTATGGTRGGDAFLMALNGMIYGDDPAQGVIEGQTFRYPPDRIQFTAPVGYGMNNGAAAVSITPTTGRGGQATFTGGKFDGNLDAFVARQFAALSGDANARVEVTPQRTTINGLTAATATVAASSGGQAVDATVVAIVAAPGTAYAFTVIQPRGAGLGSLAPLVQSFRRMTAAETAAVRPRVIQVVTVGRTDTVASLAGRMAFDDAREDRFRVLNGIPAGVRTLPAGRRVKLVVWGTAGRS